MLAAATCGLLLGGVASVSRGSAVNSRTMALAATHRTEDSDSQYPDRIRPQTSTTLPVPLLKD